MLRLTPVLPQYVSTWPASTGGKTEGESRWSRGSLAAPARRRLARRAADTDAVGVGLRGLAARGAAGVGSCCAVPVLVRPRHARRVELAGAGATYQGPSQIYSIYTDTHVWCCVFGRIYDTWQLPVGRLPARLARCVSVSVFAGFVESCAGAASVSCWPSGCGHCCGGRKVPQSLARPSMQPSILKVHI